MPGLPLGKAENSLCRHSLPLAPQKNAKPPEYPAILNTHKPRLRHSLPPILGYPSGGRCSWTRVNTIQAHAHWQLFLRKPESLVRP